MRFFLLLLVFPFLTACASGPGVTADDRPRALEPLPANVELSRRLRLSVPIEKGEYTLDGIAAKIEREAGAAVRFDWDGLAEVGITPETTVEVLDGAPPAQRLLAMTLFEAAPQAGEVYPTYMLIDGTAVVGTNRSLVRLAPQVSWPADGPRAVEPMTASSLALRRLERIVTLNAQPAPLENLINFFADVSGAQFEVVWPALENVGVDPDMEVSVDVERVTIDEALEYVLDAASHDLFDGDRLEFRVIEGVVFISTRDDLLPRVMIALYDVRDLVDRMYGPMLEAVYADDPFALTMLERYDLAWCIDFAELPPMFDPTYPEIIEEAQEQFAERSRLTEMLVELIEDTVGDADEWIDEYSTIQELNGNLIVRTTERNHRAIENLLGRLREGQRGTIRRFMREVEAARLLREAERLRAVGDDHGALAAARRAHAVDPGNEPARALRDVLEEAVEREEAR